MNEAAELLNQLSPPARALLKEIGNEVLKMTPDEKKEALAFFDSEDMQSPARYLYRLLLSVDTSDF